MEPLKGGKLTSNIPPAIQELWDSAPVKRSSAEWCFKWLARMPEVTLMLSGMSSRQQLEENIKIISSEDLEQLSAEELAVIDEVSAEYNKLIKYSCTGCEYCLPCPQKLNIPQWVTKGHHASDCVGCGSCEEKCPQHLPIIQALKETAETFGV